MSEDLTWLPAWQIRDLIVAKEVSPVEVLEHFVGRIEQYGPLLKEPFETLDLAAARRQAKVAEAAVLGDGEVGPLHGVPIAVKEHIAVAGLPHRPMPPTSVAAGLPNDNVVAVRDDIAVARLRDAGANVVGTTKMPIFLGDTVNFDFEREPRNPWDVARTPGYSSSGSAVASAARLVPLAIGTDGMGSTRIPAAFTGLVGVHPSRGLVPYANYEHPQYQMFRTVVTRGPLARDVRDAAIALQCMAGPDGRDAFCLQTDADDYLANLEAGVEGWTFAWTDDFGFASAYATSESAEVVDAVRRAAMGFTSLGATVQTTSEVWDDPIEPAMTMMATLSPYPTPVDPQQFERVSEARRRNIDRFRAVLSEADLLLSPTMQMLPWTLEDWRTAFDKEGEKYPSGHFMPTTLIMTGMFNWIGWPALTIPCGFVRGLPIGLHIIGRPGSEATMLRAARAFERAFPRAEHPQLP